MAYCKPPSLVWKPKKKDKIETQLQQLLKARISAVNAAKTKAAKGKKKVTPPQKTSSDLKKLFAENLGVVKDKK